MFLLICSLFSNKGSAKEPMSDSGKRNISFIMIEEVLQCQILSALVIFIFLFWGHGRGVSSNEGSTKEPMSDGGKRNIIFDLSKRVCNAKIKHYGALFLTSPPKKKCEGGPLDPPSSNEGSTKELMSDGDKRNVNFVLTEAIF